MTTDAEMREVLGGLELAELWRYASMNATAALTGIITGADELEIMAALGRASDGLAEIGRRVG